MNASAIPRAIESVSQAGALNRPATVLSWAADGVPRRLSQRAAAVIGHPVHPALTDLPIGFWTSAWVLDLLPGRAATATAARRLLGIGVLSAIPTAVTGVGDAAGLDRDKSRVAALHGMCNAAAMSAFACSWWMRRHRPDSGPARLVSHVGAGLATVAGLLGGHLAFGSGSDDQNDQDASASSWRSA